MSTPFLLGAIEAGGTKFVCAVGTGPGDLRTVERIPTTLPEETLGRVCDFFRAQPQITALGIGSFGPVDLNPDSGTFGYITSTPKPGWQNTSVGPHLQEALGVPVAFDTDVNAAAIGEHRWGAAQDVDSCIYLTVGTGIGGGALVKGEPLHGLVHPEMGHVMLPHDRMRDPYDGFCPFHGDCFEGLAAGPALKDRWGAAAEALPDDHPAWPLEAHYIALALVGFILTLSPERLILGGGVMHKKVLFPLIRQEVQTLLNGYVKAPQILGDIDRYIVPPGLGDRAGILGALAMAQDLA